MDRKYKRTEFIRLTALGTAGLYLSACGIHHESKDTDHLTTDTTTSAAKIEPPKKSDTPLTLYKKGDPQYDILRQGFNKRIDKHPAAIALCTSTEEVQAAIAYGIANKLPIAIKSGGHCMEGFSCIDDGLVINLSSLNHIEWIGDDKIKVGPGCTLYQIYDELLPKKKMIPSGSCGGVGIGGLSLGGGYGLFSRKLGLTCDSLEEVTMVDGHGNIQSSAHDPELLWACRGGGNGNFGVVTEMTFKIHDAPQTLTAHWFKVNNIDADRGAAILEKWFRLTPDLPLSCFCAFVLNGKLLNILLTNSEPHSEAVQKVIDGLSPMVDKVTIGKPRPLAIAIKNYFGLKGPVYFKNASAGLYKSFDDIRPCIKEIMALVNKTPGMIYQVNTMGGNIDLPQSKAASAYPHRSFHFVSELQTYWEKPAQEERLMKAFHEVKLIFNNNGIKTQYRNYADNDLKDWEHAYYSDNYERLQRVKSKYDPDDLIRSEQSIKPVSKA